MNHLTTTASVKLPKVRHSLRNSIYRDEEERRESAAGKGSPVLPPTSPRLMVTPAKKKKRSRISLAAVGHTTIGLMMKRGHQNSMREKSPRGYGSAPEATPQYERQSFGKDVPTITGSVEHSLDDLKPDVGQPENENSRDSEMVVINCSGFEYVTTETSLGRFPNSILGDPNQRKKFYSCKLKAYYFDRPRACFEAILQFYQTGTESPPTYMDQEIYHDEKEFYGLKKSRDSVIEIRENMSHSQRKKLEIHRFLIFTPTTICASVYHVTDILMIAMSTILFLLESEPHLESHFDLNAVNTTGDDTAYWLFALNSLTILWFTVDIIVRMATWPVFFRYWKNFMNILDVVSVLPFYIELIQWNSDSDSADSTYQILRALRLVRVVRVFKFVRHSESMMVILKAVAKARHELIVLFVCIFLFVITFGSVMFYLEGSVEMPANGTGPDTPFSSILMSCWWVLVSVTTVGFGDMYPVTVAGKFLGSLVLCLGIICLALPMTIIVTKFSIEFDREKS